MTQFQGEHPDTLTLSDIQGIIRNNAAAIHDLRSQVESRSQELMQMVISIERNGGIDHLNRDHLMLLTRAAALTAAEIAQEEWNAKLEDLLRKN